MIRTDLICENAGFAGFSAENRVMFGAGYSDVSITPEKSEAYGLRPGRYITVSTSEGDVKRCVCELLKEMLPAGKILVAGLGNPAVSSDSLGVKMLSHIPATAHLSSHEDFQELEMRPVYVLEAGITGKTGIESSERIACIARCVGAECVIAADSLACSGIDRLCTTVQMTDTGISPGSGAGNDRKALNAETVGIPVIAIGVPTVIDLDCLTDSEKHSGFMVTPRDIDLVTDRLARMLGTAISTALNPSLSEGELRALIIP